MMLFSGEGTVLNCGVTVAKEFDVQEKIKLEIFRFWSRCPLMTGGKVVLHHKPVNNMMRVTIAASGIPTLVFIPSCDRLNNFCHFLNILKPEILL